jgi:hypothetical protein
MLEVALDARKHAIRSCDPAFIFARPNSRIEAESTALFARARLWDDGLIDPHDSRRVLAFCLSVCREALVRQLKPSTFGSGEDIGDARDPLSPRIADLSTCSNSAGRGSG